MVSQSKIKIIFTTKNCRFQFIFHNEQDKGAVRNEVRGKKAKTILKEVFDDVSYLYIIVPNKN